VSHITDQSALFALRRAAVRKPLIEQQLIAAGLPDPVTEFMFAKEIGRKWRFDYAWPDHKIALEIEGAVFGRLIITADGKKIRAGGRHSTGAGLQADAFKYNRAAILGWLVVRATTTMVRDGHAITELSDAFASRAGGALNVR
jgi:hypothetical protein